jgi:hypothetical protein
VTWKAISMWQPWASLWLTGRKLHETRGRALHHRGWMLVQAAKRFERDITAGTPLREILDDEFGGHWGLDLPTGAIIGAVEVVACHRVEDVIKAISADDFHCGNYGPGRFAIERRGVKRFARPIPWRGMQAVPFEVPGDSRIREAFEAAPELGMTAP